MEMDSLDEYIRRDGKLYKSEKIYNWSNPKGGKYE